MHALRQEVRRKCQEGDNAALDAREKVKLRVLKDERRRETEHDTERHRDGELEEEDGNTMEEGRNEDVFAVELGECPDEGTSIRDVCAPQIG